MNHPEDPPPDSKLDIVFERMLDVPKQRVFEAWTRPEMLKKWFTPAPWKTIEAEVDLRPGGIFRTVMESPEGERLTNLASWLEVVPFEKLVWTVALAPGFRPAPESSVIHGIPPFTCILRLDTLGDGTRYTARLLHRDEEGAKRHDGFGVRDGWGRATEQLVELIQRGGAGTGR